MFSRLYLHILTLNMLNKIQADDLEMFFFFSPENRLNIRVKLLTRRQFCMKRQILCSGENRKEQQLM